MDTVKGKDSTKGKENKQFLASQDALEVMFVTDSLTDLLIVSTDFTDVTMVSEDTY